MVSLEQYPLYIPINFSVMDDKIIESLDSSVLLDYEEMNNRVHFH